MSLNQRGKIVGQVVRSRAASSDRKHKRHPTVPAEDIIEISSDEDEELQPPPKRTFARRENPLSVDSNYKSQLFDRDQEIEKLKKVRHQRLAYGSKV